MKVLFQLSIILFGYLATAQEYRMTPKMVGNIGLGDDLQTLYSTFPSNSIKEVPVRTFGIDGSGNGFLVMINLSDSLMFVWSKDYGNTIGGIICLSDSYKTVDGLGVGSTLEDIESNHPDIVLRPDYINSSIEYATVKYGDRFMNFQVISKKGEQIGEYIENPTDEPSTKKFNRKAIISRIVIWE